MSNTLEAESSLSLKEEQADLLLSAFAPEILSECPLPTHPSFLHEEEGLGRPLELWLSRTLLRPALCQLP